MSEIRCLECGSSRLDPQGYKCGRCGKAIGLRSERCYVTDETKQILLNHSSALSKFGIELKSGQPLGKSADTVLAAAILILHCADSFDHGALHRLVQYLKQIRIEREEILRLRLDEPEKILAYYDMDQCRANCGEAAAEGLSAESTLPGTHGQRRCRSTEKEKATEKASLETPLGCPVARL